jgi:Domain of unknown function (DUF4263)
VARLDRWKESRRLLTVLGGDHKPVVEFIQAHWKRLADADNPIQEMTQGSLIEAARELVFEMRDGIPFFSVVIYAIASERLQIEIASMLEILPPDDRSEASVSDHVRNILATAAIHETPVYPNTDEDEPHLLRFHREMLTIGSTAPDSTGARIRLKLTSRPGEEIDSANYIESVSATRWFSPAELGLIRNVVVRELREREAAGQILGSLRIAVEELTQRLTADARNEADLQNCLTESPILFGPEYVRVIPQYRLGAEFQMDYALERISGLVDLVEIEASSHALFTKSGNPTQQLVHAEQQVFDWIDWIERHGEYARFGLPGLVSPTGYVVIGRNASLSEADRSRLTRRNRIFQGRLVILTYDDLAARGQALLKILTGLRRTSTDA